MVTEDNEELNQPKLGVVPRIAILGISVFLMLSSSADVTCKYCGQKRQSVQALVSAACPLHPAGVNKGKHALFEGMATEKFTCVYCGQQRSSMTALVSAVCPRHPNGVNKGRHSAYEGADKSEYVCKYCGQKRQSVQTLVTSPCPRHPDGVNKGKHSPAR